MRFVDVKNDVAFRKIFGNEARKEVLISFLNAVLQFEEGRRITDVHILTPYQLPAFQSGKVTIVDVKASDQQGRQYIVEMQVAEDEWMNKRVLYYASKSYSSQLDIGERYSELTPVYLIGILDFKATQNCHYISRHRIQDVETGENYISDIEFTFIELPKFEKEETELTGIVDQWIYFIKNAENLHIIPEDVTDSGLKLAYTDAEKYNWTKQELDAYENVDMRTAVDRNAAALLVKRALAQAAQDAKQAAKQATEEAARNLLQAGVELEIVAQSLGLTIEEVRRLQKV